jgi:hypothetical protein
MKDHGANPHPGPWRVMRGDTEFAGLLVAVGFLVMGLVSMPIATWFVLGAVIFGGVVALLLRFTQRRFLGAVAGTLIVLVVAVLWWTGRPLQRPHGVSSNAVLVTPNNVAFTLHWAGYWVDCWFDEPTNVDRCKLTDANGDITFEDVFLPCVGPPVPQRELILDARITDSLWTRSNNLDFKVPVVHLKNGAVLLAQSVYDKRNKEAVCASY